jgi:hypothetical protein
LRPLIHFLLGPEERQVEHKVEQPEPYETPEGQSLKEKEKK